MYQRGELSVGPETSYADLSDLEAAGELTPLEEALEDDDFKASGIEDIRGRIHNQPTHLYAKINDDGPEGKTVSYYGVEESEVSEGFFS